MTTPYHVFAAGVPIVDQHSPDPDGQLTPGTDTDCGEACIQALMQWAHGVTALSTEDIRRDLLKNATGPTSPQQLSLYLANECNIPNTIIVPTTKAAYLWNEYRYLVEGKPLIALRWWETLDSGYLHYCLATEQTQDESIVMDPWAAAFVTEGYDLHWQMALGHATLIGIDRVPDA
jgi:hypothetical protein